MYRHADVVVSDRAWDVLNEERIDFLLLHWLSYDVGRLIDAARKKGIPFGIINHFDNRRLEGRRVRSWLRAAAGIAGVSARNVPRSLRSIFVERVRRRRRVVLSTLRWHDSLIAGKAGFFCCQHESHTAKDITICSWSP